MPGSDAQQLETSQDEFELEYRGPGGTRRRATVGPDWQPEPPGPAAAASAAAAGADSDLDRFKSQRDVT